MKQFDRTQIAYKKLNERVSKSYIEKIAILPDTPLPDITEKQNAIIEHIAKKIIQAKKNHKSIIITYGAHVIKNGLGFLLSSMIENGWITHLATNGAGTIHDWEFAFQGKTEEDVRTYLSQGQFGIWEETTKNINLALLLSAYNNEGYGEAIGKMIANDSLNFPSIDELTKQIENNIQNHEFNTIGCLNLLNSMKHFQLPEGNILIKHPWKKYSVCYHAYKEKIPLTVHPGFGYDIIYTHPYCNGIAIGKTAEVDFLRYVQSLRNLNGGVFISIGSAIMSPMIFEKGLSMARNVALQHGENIDKFLLIVNDIQEGEWKWGSKQEPPKTNPAYFLRFCKSFDRAQAEEMHYLCLDNRSFLQHLYAHLLHNE